jgi:hypothetical protein
MARSERHEVDAESVEAKPKPKQGNKEGCGHDEPAVIEARCRRSLNRGSIMHGLELDRFAGRALAVIGPDPPIESDSSYRGGCFRRRLGFHDYGIAARA